MKQVKSLFGCFLISIFFLCGCNSSVEETATQAATSAPANTYTPSITITPQATLTSSPTVTSTAEPTPTDHPGWMPEGTVRRFGKGSLFDMALTSDKKTVAIGATEGIYLADSSTGNIKDFFMTYFDPYSIVFSADGERIYVGVGEEGVRIFQNSDSGWNLIKQMPNACASLLALSSDENTLLTACFRKNMRITLTSWDVSTNKQLFELSYRVNYHNLPMAFSPTDPEIVAFARNEILTIMNSRTGDVIQTYSADPTIDLIYDIDYSPDGTQISLSTVTNDITILDSESLEVDVTFKSLKKVYQLSFIDNDTLLSMCDGNIVVQDLQGKRLQTIEYYGKSNHVYVPENNLVFVDHYFDVDIFSLDSKKLHAQVHGFHPSYWQGNLLSDEGNILVISTGYAQNTGVVVHMSNVDDPDYFQQQDFSKYCKTQYFSKIIDEEENLLMFYCPEISQYLIINTQQNEIVHRWDYSLTKKTSDRLSSPDGEEQILAAMLHEKGEETYGVEIWNLLTQMKISEFEIEDYNPENRSSFMSGFSPHGTYIVIKNKNNNIDNIYDTLSGEIIQSIVNIEDQLLFNDDESMVFLQSDYSFSAYDLISGDLLQRYSLQKKQPMTYLDKEQKFYTFSNRNGSDGSIIVDINSYQIDSPKIFETHSITLPAATAEDDLAQTSYKFLCQTDYIRNGDYVIFLPEMQGNKALMFTRCNTSSSNMKINKIFLVNIENESILKSYTYIDFEIFSHEYQVIGDSLYSTHENYMFEWDISLN